MYVLTNIPPFWRNCTLGETWLRIDTILKVCGKIMKLSLGWTKMMGNNIYDVNDVSTEMYYHLMMVWPLKTMTIEKTSLKYCIWGHCKHACMDYIHHNVSWILHIFFSEIHSKRRQRSKFNSVRFFLLRRTQLRPPYCDCSFNTINHNHQTYLSALKMLSSQERLLITEEVLSKQCNSFKESVFPLIV